MPAQPDTPRIIAVRLQLEGGQSIDTRLREDAPELVALFQILASRGNDAVEPMEKFLQLPLQDGKAACSFNSRQLVSITTEPPVIVRLELPEPARTDPAARTQHEPRRVAAGAHATVVHTPRYRIIDDFLSPDEYERILAFALQHEGRFESGTVEGHASPLRQNKVIMGFVDTEESRLMQNRLLTWLPHIARSLGIGLFPVGHVESQLTASNDGHFYRMHSDAGSNHADTRVLTCVYYFFRQPRPFGGGALRLYDMLQQDGRRQATSEYREFDPVSNRLLVFHSAAYHELMPIRCPSRQFADSRFAVTNWIHRTDQPNSDARFGWGHLRCGVVPAQLEA